MVARRRADEQRGTVRLWGVRVLPVESNSVSESVMFRRVGTVAVLAAAAGAPYVASETQWGRDAASAVTGLVAGGVSDGGAGGAAEPVHAHYEVETLRRADPERFRYEDSLASKLDGGAGEGEALPSLVGARVDDIREILRFDITDRWVINRFSRVSTVLADLRLRGLRVPIVTGTQASDLAGTLTYYFDHSGKLQRVTIHGFTGNPQRLVETMTRHYGLQSEPSLEAGVYTRRWNGAPIHFLRLTHAPVVYSDAVHQKYTVFLELNEPDLAYGISEEAERIVSADRGTGRW